MISTAPQGTNSKLAGAQLLIERYLSPWQVLSERTFQDLLLKDRNVAAGGIMFGGRMKISQGLIQQTIGALAWKR